jgi:hypothetical protein
MKKVPTKTLFVEHMSPLGGLQLACIKIGKINVFPPKAF